MSANLISCELFPPSARPEGPSATSRGQRPRIPRGRGLRRSSGAGNATNNFRRRLRGAACGRVIRGLRPRLVSDGPSGREDAERSFSPVRSASEWLQAPVNWEKMPRRFGLKLALMGRRPRLAWIRAVGPLNPVSREQHDENDDDEAEASSQVVVARSESVTSTCQEQDDK